MRLKRSYRFLRGIVRVFSHKMTTVWEVPFDGKPSVFCPNHADAAGPIDICAHFELCDSIRPWFNADVAEAKKVPAYVRQDYWWEPGCKLEPLYNATLPYLAAAVLPPILRTTPGIRVYHDSHVLKTFRESVAALKEGDSLVIFPEQPDGFGSHSTTLNKGFLLIAPMAQRELGIALNFYPVHIDHHNHRIFVRKPIAYQPERTLREQEQEILDHIAAGI